MNWIRGTEDRGQWQTFVIVFVLTRLRVPENSTNYLQRYELWSVPGGGVNQTTALCDVTPYRIKHFFSAAFDDSILKGKFVTLPCN